MATQHALVSSASANNSLSFVSCQHFHENTLLRRAFRNLHLVCFHYRTSRLDSKYEKWNSCYPHEHIILRKAGVSNCRSQLQHDPRHGLSLLARTLRSWFEFHSMHGCLYCVRLLCICIVMCVGRGLAMG
jgi:hypothetical protein